MSRLTLIDFSSIARPIYEASGNSPNVDQVSIDIVARIRALAGTDPHVAICCDSGRSFRHDISADYKAQRPETPAPYLHQCALALDVLRGDGFPVWQADGFEADDIIASAVSFVKDDSATCGWCGKAHEGGPECCDGHAMIITGDKDMHQLINARVEVFKPANGKNPAVNYDLENFETQHAGLKPSQIVDYLALVGDASDNIKGADGIGPKKAAALLTQFGNLDDLYAAMDGGAVVTTPANQKALIDFYPRMAEVRSLLTLRTDAPIPFEEIFKPRVPADTQIPEDDMTDDINEAMPTLEQADRAFRVAKEIDKAVDEYSKNLVLKSSPPMPTLERHETEAGAVDHYVAADRASDVVRGDAIQGSERNGREDRRGNEVHQSTGEIRRESADARHPQAPSQAVAQPQAEVMAPDFQHALEPRNIGQAIQLANAMFKSRLFSAYGTPEAVLSTVLAGREIGMQAMSALRAFHIIDGKPTLSAGAIHAMILSSGKSEYFRCSERTPERATFVTKRKGEPEMSLTVTLDEGRRAFAGDDKKWASSGWGKNPADMLVARASSKLARLIYPDVVHNLYAPEELSDDAR